MGMPAARLLDTTAHGGLIAMGFPTVMIGGMPAARLGDMHLCPMATPAPVPVPHVGGPILMGSTTVLIGGKPAARVSDMALCVGPPDVIALGCLTVLIGMAGSGSATVGGGAAGAPGASGTAGGAATISAGIAMIAGGGPGLQSGEAHWIEFDFVDSAGNPVSDVRYKFTAPDSEEYESTLGGEGKIYWSGSDAGQGTVKLMSLSNAKWSENKVKVGESVKMTADIEGYDAGTPASFQVYSRDVKGADKLVATLEAETESSKVETEWEYEYPDDVDEVLDDESEKKRGYSALEYYFIVTVENSSARSDFLVYEDELEIELKDVEENPIPDEEYYLHLPNGEIRKGQLDGNGYKKEENIPPGYFEIKFPNLSDDTDTE